MPLAVRFENRITELFGVEVPIANSPMGFVAKPDLVAAVANAGGIGLVPGSMGIAGAREDIKRVRELTDRPVGVNLPIAFVRDASIADMLVDERIPFVTTSAGSPAAFTPVLKDAGMKVLHVVTSYDSASDAVDAGVDGLVVEGIEGAGLKGQAEVASSVLLPLLARKVGLPMIAAGGIADGVSMASAFVLGAEGVQMGTRMVASVEANVHDGLKQAIIGASETDTVLVNRHNGRPMRVLRTDTTSELEFATEGDPMASDLLFNTVVTYTEGIVENSLPSVGQVAGRIDSLLPVAEIMRRTVEEFGEAVRGLEQRYLGVGGPPDRTPEG